VYDQILYEVDDPVATITLNRPDRLNGWTQQMGDEVRHAVARAERDAAVVGIVITGAGRAFCAGADLGNLDSLADGGGIDTPTADLSVEWPDPLPDDFSGEYTYLLGIKKPVIAAINGAVAGMAVPISLC
jgi:enoyl-CoA hydratase/carnithine racemase